MWAALLANAASPNDADKARPSFIAILKEMAPDEAALLNWIHARSQGWTHHLKDLDWFKAEVELGFGDAKNRRLDSRMICCLDGLEAQQLIRRNYLLPSDLAEPQKVESHQVPFRIVLSDRGSAFIDACRPPKPKS